MKKTRSLSVFDLTIGRRKRNLTRAPKRREGLVLIMIATSQVHARKIGEFLVVLNSTSFTLLRKE